ncbi:hypothetical protein CQA57_00330 [Helicobacter anseris]|uniref:Lipoprotein n=1 Tax=Helicobacter anseris TaxID=375926 RepID=A0A3D8JBJ7_9HELI|nr:hypothetical protein [Helicobacter anseris]RDU74535.1 hypothetical protein CQA57_00330 [Helicobacter anseris]
MNFFNLLKFKSFAYCSIALVILFFSSCAGTKNLFTNKPVRGQKQIAKEELPPPDFKLLFIKSPKFSYYDYALLRIQDDAIYIELFKLGQNIGNISIFDTKICFMNDCAPKWPSAKEFFGKVAYANLFDDILLGKDIFDGKGKMVGEGNAIIQRFQQSGQIIYYERKQGHILFQNLSTGVTISLDDYVDPSKQYEKK